jgi:hypothetical protein
MKSKLTLGLATAMFTLTLSAFPPHAAASSTIAPPSTSSEAIRKAGGSNLIYVQVVLAAGNLLSALLP